MDEAPDGALTFKWAALADKFGALPAEIADLTDAQIDDVLFHKRDKDGALVPPEATERKSSPPTRESRLTSIAQLEAMGLITTARADELRKQVNDG